VTGEIVRNSPTLVVGRGFKQLKVEGVSQLLRYLLGCSKDSTWLGRWLPVWADTIHYRITIGNFEKKCRFKSMNLQIKPMNVSYIHWEYTADECKSIYSSVGIDEDIICSSISMNILYVRPSLGTDEYKGLRTSVPCHR
jgi:hypothetical protein